MILVICTAIVSLLILCMLFRKFSNVDINLPGPCPWPIVGNILQIMANKPHATLDRWHKQYNGIYKMFRMGTPVVVVGTYESIHEVLVSRGKAFAGRPVSYRRQLWADFNSCLGGITFSNPDASWKRLRVTAQKHLKQYDTGLVGIENVTIQTCNELMENFASHYGRPFQPRKYILNSVMNITTLFLLGKKFTKESDIFNEFLDVERLNLDLLSATGPHALVDLFPWLGQIGFKLWKSFNTLNRQRDLLFNHMKTESAGSENLFALFHDLYTSGQLEDEEMRMKLTAMDMIIAGSSTTTNTFHYFINILTHYPDVYHKLQIEVEDVLGDRLPTLEDRHNMPYVMATLFEVLRYTSIVPLSVPHMALHDSMIGNVVIPKGTEVIINLWSYLHDEAHWPQPFTFRPERFLDQSGKLLPPDHEIRRRLSPFGAGPRICLGGVFANSRLFLLMCSLIQRFDIEQLEPKVSCDPRNCKLTLVIMDPNINIVMTPRSFK